MHERKEKTLQSVEIVTQLFILILQFQTTESTNISLPGCLDRCGDIPIPYPFGIGANCSISRRFNVTCSRSVGLLTNKNRGKPIPYLYNDNDYIEILNISVPLGQVRMKNLISLQCYNSTIKQDHSISGGLILRSTSFWLNNKKNKFVVTGCNTFGRFILDSLNYSVGCLSTCDSLDTLNKYGPSCSGIGCCQTAIPKVTNAYGSIFDERYNHSIVHNFSGCSYAMAVEEDSFVFNTTSITTENPILRTVPVVFDWTIGNKTCKEAEINKYSYACKSIYSVCVDYINGPGYICNCSDGYEGNPYLEGGCQDIDECANRNPCSKQGKCHNLPGKYRCSCPFGWRKISDDICELNLALVIGSCVGIVALSFLGFAIYFIMERINLSKVKQKYFQQNGGWILLEKIKSTQGFGFTIFTKQQIEQATNNFDTTNIIGHGGYGTVYKGILQDQTVAIKKCKTIDESKKKEFGKEMLILFQINHKNIVKLLGCCLEVEVPILVYEFIPNGNLFQYIHHKKKESQMSFTTRLRIAHESAEALAYLHTSASPPIFHGDVKSANILLDQNYTAKVSDFGASVLAPTDEAQYVTFVQGTLGYLDPEYMQTSQLTDKSDVYSFGVVLLELLTSKRAINYDAPEEERNLLSYFVSAMRENKLEDVLDDEIKHGGDIEIVREVADLALECLSMKREERPLMKEVAEELQRIRKLNQHPWGHEDNTEETRTLLNDIEIEHTSYYFTADKEAEESIALGR